MIEIFAFFILILSSIIIAFGIFWYFYIYYKHNQLITHIFHTKTTDELIEKKDGAKEKFKKKLARAGLTQKQFNEIVIASIATGASLFFLLYVVEFDTMMEMFIVVLAIGIMVLTPFLYLDEQIKARIKRIDDDLAIFIDMLIIILEGGGGLNNAIDKVTQEATNVLGKDLLEESKRFKYEMITYGSEVAYKNLSERTGSEAIATIVGFMRLSEETGIGVKTIFENQSQEIKAKEVLNVEKKAATMNISITFVMFVFILPAVIMMIAFPMAADALMPGF